MKEYIFLIIILIIVGVIFWINRKRNAWDVMFFNTTLAILVLFMIGILENDVWGQVAYALGGVAIGQGLAGIGVFCKSKEEIKKRDTERE